MDWGKFLVTPVDGEAVEILAPRRFFLLEHEAKATLRYGQVRPLVILVWRVMLFSTALEALNARNDRVLVLVRPRESVDEPRDPVDERRNLSVDGPGRRR